MDGGHLKEGGMVGVGLAQIIIGHLPVKSLHHLLNFQLFITISNEVHYDRMLNIWVTPSG